MNNRDKKIMKDLEKNNCISIKLFLISYCRIYNRNLLDSKITHNHIKILFPHLRRVSFIYVLENIKEVYIGNILLVKDSVGHVVPYIKPDVKELGDIKVDCGYPNKFEDNDDKFEKAVCLEDLSMHELLQLCKKYKEQNRINEYRKICRLIKKYNKDSGIVEYHKKKEKILMKGRDEND